MRKEFFSGLMLLVAGATLSSSGCSLVGFGIGAMVDAAKDDTTNISGSKLLTVDEGTSIDIMLRSGEQVTGTYEGLRSIPEEEYSILYAQAMDKEPEIAILPALHDSVRVTLRMKDKPESDLWCELLGFDFTHMKVKRSNLANPSRLNLSLVKKITDSHGNMIEGDFIRELAREGKLPSMRAIAVRGARERTLVAMHDVYQIAIPAKKNAKWVGLAVGAAVDLVGVIVVATQDKWVIELPSR